MAEVNRRAVRPGAVVPIRSDDPSIEELSRQLNDLRRSLPDFVTQGVELSFSLAAPGSQALKHGLGRLPLGFLMLNINYPGAAGSWCQNGWDANLIYLYSSAPASGKIWVF